MLPLTVVEKWKTQEDKVIWLSVTEANLPWHASQLKLFSKPSHSFFFFLSPASRLGKRSYVLFWLRNVVEFDEWKKVDIIMHGYQASKVNETLQVNKNLTHTKLKRVWVL